MEFPKVLTDIVSKFNGEDDIVQDRIHIDHIGPMSRKSAIDAMNKLLHPMYFVKYVKRKNVSKKSYSIHHNRMKQKNALKRHERSKIGKLRVIQNRLNGTYNVQDNQEINMMRSRKFQNRVTKY